MGRPRWVFVAMIVFVSVIMAARTVVGCGAVDEPEATVRPLTAAEGALLAEVLYDNFESGGAGFEAVAAGGPGQGTFTLSGEVDWIQSEGIAEVLGASGDAPVTAVIWNPTTIGERRPDIDALVAGQLGDDDVPVLVRSPDSTGRRLDQVISVITGLAAPQRDNAQLIAQTPGSAFLRNDVLRGREVAVLRYGQRNVYWVDVATGKLLRFEGNDASGRYPVVVDIVDRGLRTIELPQDSVVVEVATISELYDALAPTSP